MRALIIGTTVLLGCAGPPFSARLVAPNSHQVATATEGATYEIEFTNTSKQNVGLVVSIDGLDLVSGEPMEWSREAILQRGGYVVDTNTIAYLTGFPVSASNLSSFRFVDAPLAYASHRAAPQDLGKIEIGIYGLRTRAPYLGQGQYAPPTILPPSSSAPATVFGQLITDTYRTDTDHEQDPDRELGHLVLRYGGYAARLGTAGPPPVIAPQPPVRTQPTIEHKPPGKQDKPRKKHIDNWKG